MLLLSSVPVFFIGWAAYVLPMELSQCSWVFLGERGVVLASGLLGQSCEGQNTKHLGPALRRHLPTSCHSLSVAVAAHSLIGRVSSFLDSKGGNSSSLIPSF